MQELQRGLEEPARRRGAATVLTLLCRSSRLDFQEHVAALITVGGWVGEAGEVGVDVSSGWVGEVGVGEGGVRVWCKLGRREQQGWCSAGAGCVHAWQCPHSTPSPTPHLLLNPTQLTQLNPTYSTQLTSLPSLQLSPAQPNPAQLPSLPSSPPSAAACRLWCPC